MRTPDRARNTVRVVQLSYTLIKVHQMDALMREEIAPNGLAVEDTMKVKSGFRGGFRDLLDRPCCWKGSGRNSDLESPGGPC